MMRASAMAALGVLALAMNVSGCDGRTGTHGHEDDHAHGDAAERGARGGRMLHGDGLDLEVTIFESGVPPEFRIYPSSDGKPLDPAAVGLTAIVSRLGGKDETIPFEAVGSEYLRGLRVVGEPHSFDVTLRPTFQGRGQELRYSQVEGRVQLSDEAALRAGIEVAPAGSHRIRSTIELPGQVEPNRDRLAHVVARLAGIVTEVPVTLGTRVRRGTLLAAIDSRELAESKSEYIESVHRLEYAQATYLREERLWRRGITAEQEYLRARHELEESEIARQIAEQKLLALGISHDVLAMLAVEPSGTVVDRRVRAPFAQQALTRYAVESPLDGQVLEREVAVGEVVTVDRTLFVVADLSTVWVEFSVPPKDLLRARSGQDVVVRSKSPALEAAGRITYLSPTLGEGTRTAPARVDLPNPEGEWRPGLFVTVELLEEESQAAVAVPAEAIQQWREQPVVFIRVRDLFEVRPVELGRSDGEWVEIVSGLEAGQLYAARNAFVLKADLGKSTAEHDP